MLDGLPGRQMAIDADLHAGVIDQHEAHRRRDDVYRQADFFGAMDGAGKFVRGDAVAGVVILLVNIARRALPGRGQLRHEPGRGGQRLHQADDRRRPGQPGPGLPDLAGRRTDRDPLVVLDRPEPRRHRAIVHAPGVLGMAAVFVGLMALTPLPKLPLLRWAAAWAPARCSWAPARRSDRRAEDRSAVPVTRRECWLRSRPESDEESRRGADSGAGKASPSASAEAEGDSAEVGSDRMEDLLHVDPLELEIGFRLIGLADPTRSGDLLGRLKTVRQRVAREMGLIVPQVRIHDEIGLPPNEYRVKIRGTQVGQGIAYAGRLLAVPPAGLVTRPDGRDGVDPVTGQPAVWIHADGREVAELAGCRVLDASAVVAGHFGEIVADHADELLDPRAGRAAARAGPIHRADPGRRSRARAPPRRRAPARLAEPAAGTRQHPRPGNHPGDAGRPRRSDQGHRSS